MTNTRFLKSMKKQMFYNHNFKTMEIMGVQALTLVVRVEVEPGYALTSRATFAKNYWY
jgi:hypothetical protein